MPHTSVKALPRWRPLKVKKTAPEAHQPQPTVSPTPKLGPHCRPSVLKRPARVLERGKTEKRPPLPE